MSSHHFVREDQEPALLILDAETIAFSKIQELLEWSPTVIVNEPALLTVLGWGIKVDIVIAAIAHQEKIIASLSEQGPLRWIWLEAGDDSLEMAFHFLAATRQKNVSVIGIDPSMFSKVQEWLGRINAVLFHNQLRWSFLPTGKLEKWFPQGTSYLIGMANGTVQECAVLEDGIEKLYYAEPVWLGESL